MTYQHMTQEERHIALGIERRHIIYPGQSKYAIQRENKPQGTGDQLPLALEYKSMTVNDRYAHMLIPRAPISDG